MAYQRLTKQFDADMSQVPNEGEHTMINEALVPMYKELGFGGLPEVFANITNEVLKDYPHTVVINLDLGICAINGCRMDLNEGLLNHLKNQRDCLSAVLTMTPRTRRMYPTNTSETEDLELQTRAMRSYLAHGVITYWDLVLLRELGNALSGHVNTEDAQQWNENAVECDKEIGRNRDSKSGGDFGYPAGESLVAFTWDASSKTLNDHTGNMPTEMGEPTKTIAPTKSEQGNRSEGRISQMQIASPMESDIFYDLYATLKVSKRMYRGHEYTNRYRDPKGSTKSALMALVQLVEGEEANKANAVLRWKIGAGTVIAATFKENSKGQVTATAPASVMISLREVYEYIALKDEGFADTWALAKKMAFGNTKMNLIAFNLDERKYGRMPSWYTETERTAKIEETKRVNKKAWILQQRLIRMISVINGDWADIGLKHGFLMLKCWGRLVDEWRVALGHPLTKEIQQEVRIKRLSPPKVKPVCTKCGRHMTDNVLPGGFIIGREDKEGQCIHCLDVVRQPERRLKPAAG